MNLPTCHHFHTGENVKYQNVGTTSHREKQTCPKGKLASFRWHMSQMNDNTPATSRRFRLPFRGPWFGGKSLTEIWGACPDLAFLMFYHTGGCEVVSYIQAHAHVAVQGGAW